MRKARQKAEGKCGNVPEEPPGMMIRTDMRHVASGCDVHGCQHPAPDLSCPAWPLPPSSLSHPHAASLFLSSLPCPSSQLVNVQLLFRAKGYGCHLEALLAQRGATVPRLETSLIVTTGRCYQHLVDGGQKSLQCTWQLPPTEKDPGPDGPSWG